MSATELVVRAHIQNRDLALIQELGRFQCRKRVLGSKQQRPEERTTRDKCDQNECDVVDQECHGVEIR
jgi:hypothetical protein